MTCRGTGLATGDPRSAVDFDDIIPGVGSSLIDTGKSDTGFEATYLATGTDFSVLPSTQTFETVEQPASWTIGAALNGGPIRSAQFPTTLQPCTVDPMSIASGVTTAENASCKFDTDGGEAYADMQTTFSGGGTTTHTANISSACDSSVTYYIRCIDTVTSDINQTDLEFTITVSPASGPPQPSPVSMVSGGNVSVESGGNVTIQAP